MEAHAADTWPMGFEVEIPQTFTIDTRCKAANDFVMANSYEFQTRIDIAPENTFNKFFAAWPLRFYVIEMKNGIPTMTYIHEPEGDLVLVKRLHEFLDLKLRQQ